MATNPMSEVIQHLRRVLRDGAGLTDEQLLEDYISRHDEAAFAALVRRHGPMVWGVCRRVLRNHQDAENVFQATFLVLVRRAASISSRELLANWLYGVAHLTALKARATAAKRKERERQVTEMPEPAVTQQDQWRDVQPVLDEELSRLPDKYRGVIVLCDLEGKTRKEVAVQLDCPEGTVASRLVRARTMLAKRLTQRGIALSTGALAVVLAQQAVSAGVPNSVVDSTIKAAALVAAGEAATTGVISVKVAALMEGVLKAMFLSNLKTLTAPLLLAALLIGAAAIYQTQAAQQPKGEKNTNTTVDEPASPPGKAEPQKDRTPKKDLSVKDNDENTPTAEAKKLQGEWQAVEIQAKGKTLTKDDSEVKNLRFVIKGDGITIPHPSEDGKGRKQTFKVNSAKSPKEIDLTSVDGQEKDKIAACIYKLDKDRLTICIPYFTEDPSVRPTEFKAGANDGIMMITLERVKAPAERLKKAQIDLINTTQTARFEAVKKEIADAQRVFKEAITDGIGNAQTDKFYQELRKKEHECFDAAVAIANMLPTSDAGFNCLVWVLSMPPAYNSPAAGPAMKLLTEHHATNPEIGTGIACLAWLNYRRSPLLGTPYPEAIALLETVARKNPDKTVRGQAALGLALVASEKYRFAESSPPPPPALNGKPGASSDAEQLAELAEKAFKEVVQDYGECKDLRTQTGCPVTTIGDVAKKYLFELQHLRIGKTAPDIEGEDLSGKKLKLSDYRGKVVLLVFWASWCGPCMAAVSHEKELVERFKKRPFVLLGVSGDENKEDANRAVQKHNIPWRSFWQGEDGANGPISTTWNVAGWPTIYIIDAKGVIRHMRLYGNLLDDPLEQLLRQTEQMN